MAVGVDDGICRWVWVCRMMGGCGWRWVWLCQCVWKIVNVEDVEWEGVDASGCVYQWVLMTVVASVRVSDWGRAARGWAAERAAERPENVMAGGGAARGKWEGDDDQRSVRLVEEEYFPGVRYIIGQITLLK